MIRILIVDDHLISGLGTKALLMSADDMEVVEIARSSEEALNLLLEHEVDVVLLDLYMPEVDGFETLTKLKQLFPKLKIVILTISEEKEKIIKAISLNADGYIFKDTSQDELFRAIRKVFRGSRSFNSRAFDLIFDDLREYINVSDNKEESSQYHLDFNTISKLVTPRELLILKMIGNRMSSKEISSQFGISIYTVNTYRKNLYSKLKVKNLSELVAAAKIVLEVNKN
ncbi:MAG: response regulator transcription factor [Ignavibacteria bacterium]|nr:response regulator transcription factor [Ignavibacteria bacterium]